MPPAESSGANFIRSLTDGVAKYLVVMIFAALGGLVVQHFDVKDLRKRVSDLEDNKTGGAVVLSTKLTSLEAEINRRFNGMEDQLGEINRYLREH